MPDPIPRNRSARGRRPRRSVRQRIWPVRPAQRPTGNVEQPAPPPRQQPPPARQRDWPNPLFRRPQENTARHAQPAQQPRPPAHQRDRQPPLFRRPRANTARHAQPRRQPRPPPRQRDPRNPLFRRPRANVRRPRLRLPQNAAQSGAKVAVGTLLLAVASLVVWIVVPLFPSGISSDAIAAPPLRDHADVAPAPGNDPDPVGDQLAAPDAVTGVDRDPAPESAAPVDLTAVRRDSGLPVATSQPDSAQHSQPSEPANVADLDRRADPPATDQGQRDAPQPTKPSPPKETPTSKPPPTPPPANPGPTPEEQHKELARKLAQFARDWKDNASSGKPKPSQDGQGRVAKPDVKQKSRSDAVSQQKGKGASGGGGSSSGSSPSGSSGSE